MGVGVFSYQGEINMDTRQQAALSFLGDIDATSESRDELTEARAASKAKRKGAVSTGATAIGALIGAYFGNPQLGAMLGKGLVDTTMGDDPTGQAAQSLPGILSTMGGNQAPQQAYQQPAQFGALPPAAGPSNSTYDMVRAAYLGGK